MQEAPVGTKVKALSDRGNYKANQIYIVHQVDTDNTFKGQDPSTGQVGGWVSWDNFVKASGLGWEFAKEMLPAEVVTFLSAFDGLENIELSDEFKDRLIRSMPRLKEEILMVSAQLDDDENT